MDNPKCRICGKKTQWHGWLQGWLCIDCDAQQIEDTDNEDEYTERQQQDNHGD
jgi:tRNA(Ile2) C34 agmatinyltransferase TiaS